MCDFTHHGGGSVDLLRASVLSSLLVVQLSSRIRDGIPLKRRVLEHPVLARELTSSLWNVLGLSPTRKQVLKSSRHRGLTLNSLDAFAAENHVLRNALQLPSLQLRRLKRLRLLEFDFFADLSFL